MTRGYSREALDGTLSRLYVGARYRYRSPITQASSGPWPGSGTRPGRGSGPRRGRRPRCSSGSSAGRSGCGGCWRSCSCSRSSRRWSRATCWCYTNEVDILLVFTPARVEVESGRVSDVTSSVVRYNGDVLAYLVLGRIAFERSKRIAHRHIGRPRNTAIGAVGVKQLRVG